MYVYTWTSCYCIAIVSPFLLKYPSCLGKLHPCLMTPTKSFSRRGVFSKVITPQMALN